MHVRIACLLAYCSLTLSHANAPRPADPDAGHARPDAVAGNDTPRTPEPGTGERIVYEAQTFVGTREATGNNDGAAVERIIGNSGFPAKSQIPWCGCFNRIAYDQAKCLSRGPQGKDSAWSPNWVLNPTWTRSKGGREPRPGDTFGIYFSSLSRVGHTGMIKEWGSANCFTVEGNTNDALSRDGDGVYAKRRPVKSLFSVRSWL